MEMNQARSAVLKAGLRLVEAGLIARTWGNVSCRVDASFVITPSGRSYQSLTADDLVQVKIDDLSYQGPIKPSSEGSTPKFISCILRLTSSSIPPGERLRHCSDDLKEIPVGGADRDWEGGACAAYALPDESLT